MKYENVFLATFLSRPNRFIAKVLLEGQEETVHVKNTGRCKELLIPGCRVYLERSKNPERKTAFDLIAVEKKKEDGSVLLINMDSQVVNTAAAEWLPKSGLFSPDAKIYREYTHKDSRFDFYIEEGERKAFLEVKGVTLEADGAALFPDAPTERGVKHLRGLAEAVGEGYEAYVLFVIQMKHITHFSPNKKMHKAFADALCECRSAGVNIIAMDCRITEDSIEIDSEVEIIL